MKHQQPTSHTSHPMPTEKVGAAQVQPHASGDGHDEAIRKAAYSFYEARGQADGHELDDWLQAEAQHGQSLTNGADASASVSSAH